MNIEIKLAQLQESNTEFSITEIEKENLSLFKVKDLPLAKKTITLLEKENIFTLADLVSIPVKTIKVGMIGFNEIECIKEKYIDEIYEARNFQRSFPKDEESLTLLSELQKDFSFFSRKTKESIWYDICRKNLSTPVSNPFLSYVDLLYELLLIPESLLLLRFWFKEITANKNKIKIADFTMITSSIPHVSLMINALMQSRYLFEDKGYYIGKDI